MLDVRPKSPEEQKLLDQLPPQQGVRYKTQGLFVALLFSKKGKKACCSHPRNWVKAVISEEALVPGASSWARCVPRPPVPPLGPGSGWKETPP